MRFLPIQDKPEFDISYKSSVITIPDLVSKDVAARRESLFESAGNGGAVFLAVCAFVPDDG